MSKKLEKRATRLRRKAENRALAIRRVVREYHHDAIETSTAIDAAKEVERQQEIERAVVKYNAVHKALRRLRKRIELE